MRGQGESGHRPGRFSDVRYVEATGSTNADVAALARAGAPEGVVVVTDHQRAGRGRRGRTWTAPPGAALLASVLVRPRLAPSMAPLVSLAAGVAAVEACHDVAGLAPSLKWPNDLMAESPARDGAGAAPAATATATGRGTAPTARTAATVVAATATTTTTTPKLAGLLAESLVEGGELRAVVIGMGCNLRRAIVDDWCGSAASIVHNTEVPAAAAYLEDLAGCPVDRDDLLHAWLTRLDQWCTTLEGPGGARAVLEAYRRRCTTLGRLVRVELAGAGGFVDGRAVDVTDGGHLVVETVTARRTVTAGDVVHLRPASEPA